MSCAPCAGAVIKVFRSLTCSHENCKYTYAPAQLHHVNVHVHNVTLVVIHVPVLTYLSLISQSAIYDLETVVGYVKEQWMEGSGNLIARIRIGPATHMRKGVRMKCFCLG